jgi:hypothetical protein
MTSSGGHFAPPPLGISDSKKGLGMEGLKCKGKSLPNYDFRRPQVFKLKKSLSMDSI